MILRLDGSNFHSYLKGFERPFDDIFIKSMQETTRYLCENVQGCQLGFTESDEITLLLVDYKRLNSQAWYDYEVEKMTSISASMVTNKFKHFLQKNIYEKYKNEISDSAFLKWIIYGEDGFECEEKIDSLAVTYLNALYKGAEFDSRCFNIPKEEVTNCVFWRQLDTMRNSVQMVGQYEFSKNNLNKKSQSKVKEMLLKEKSINWDDLEPHKKYGSCVIKEDYYDINKQGKQVKRSRWTIDKEIPIFKKEGREYIEKLVYCEEE